MRGLGKRWYDSLKLRDLARRDRPQRFIVTAHALYEAFYGGLGWHHQWHAVAPARRFSKVKLLSITLATSTLPFFSLN